MNLNMRVCWWPTGSLISFCRDLLQIERFSLFCSLSSSLRSYFLCLWKQNQNKTKHKTERCLRILDRKGHKSTCFSATKVHKIIHQHIILFRYFCVCSDHGGGLVRPVELVLVNISDNILLGGIPGAKNRRTNWEQNTQSIFTINTRCSKSGGTSLSSQIYRICHFTEKNEGKEKGR